MKKIFFIAICLLMITGCSDQKLEEDDMILSDGECCKGCLCGDTIELLKNTETAWTLTEINSNGEYVYNSKAFINFHGTGKNKFAFFRSSEDADLSGDMTINEQNEIILTPKDNKIKKITCKVGDEKNLVAVLHCDNDFGIFTLQKQGILELPNSIKDSVAKTKIVVIKTYDNKMITIKEENEINVLLSAINDSKVWTGVVNTPSPIYEIRLFDFDDKIIAEILYNPGSYFNIEINNKSYELTNIDKDLLNTLLNK